MIGICDCGVAGDTSLWMRVRRQGGLVVWAPDPASPSSSIDTTWTFELEQYLDAVDEGQRSTARWESRTRVLARELRWLRDSLSGFTMVDLETITGMRLLDAEAMYGRDDILISVATRHGVRQMIVAVQAEQTDEQILGSLNTIDPNRFE